MPSDRRRIPRNVIVIALVALASGFGQDLITPVLPGFLLALGMSSAGIGLIDGLLQGATSVFRFVSGFWSDRLQKRKGLVLVGYTLSSVARPLLALASSFGAIAALRLLDGIGKGTKDAPRDALVADSAATTLRGRAFGFQRFVDTTGSVLGPLAAAGILLTLTPSLGTYRLIFLLSAIPGILAVLLILFGIQEPAMAISSVTRQPTRPLSGTFWLFAVGTTIAMLTKINDSLFLVRAATIGVSRSWIPILFAGFTLIYALASYPIGILSDRIGKLPCIMAGWFTLAMVELGFAYTHSLSSALALFVFYGFFFALTEGSGRAFIADLVPQQSRGRAYAIFYTMTGLAVIAGGYTLGHLWDSMSPETAFGFAATGSFLSALVFAFMLLRHTRGRTG